MRLWIFKVSLFKLTLDERFCQNQKEGRRTNPHSMEESEESITGDFLFALSSPSLAMIPCLALTFPLTPMLPIFSAQYDSRCRALGTKISGLRCDQIYCNNYSFCFRFLCILAMKAMPLSDPKREGRPNRKTIPINNYINSF